MARKQHNRRHRGSGKQPTTKVGQVDQCNRRHEPQDMLHGGQRPCRYG